MKEPYVVLVGPARELGDDNTPRPVAATFMVDAVNATVAAESVDRLLHKSRRDPGSQFYTSSSDGVAYDVVPVSHFESQRTLVTTEKE